MKKADIERTVTAYKNKVVFQIKTAPVESFFVGMLLGIVLTIFRSFLLPLVLLAALVVVVLWLFAEEGAGEVDLANGHHNVAEEKRPFPGE